MGNGASTTEASAESGTTVGQKKHSSVLEKHGSEVRLKLRSVVDFLQIAHYGANDLTLTEAVQLGFMTEIAAILRSAECDVNEHDEDGNTPVMHAAGLPKTLDDGHAAADFVEILLQHNANPNWQNTAGNTALHFACEDENVESMARLLQAGADITIQNDEGQTPADLCVTQASRDIVEDFGAGTKKALPTNEQKTMQRISSAGDVLTVLTPTVVVREAPSASSIEDCCKTQGSRDDVATLLKQKADPNQVDAKGSSILMRAVWYENLGIIEALLEAKADANAKNHRLNTAVHFAYEKNNAQIIDLLVTHGGAFSLTEKNSLGKTPPQLATVEYLRTNSSEDTAAAIKATEAKKQAKVHLALSSAVIKNDLAEVEKLLAAKANVNEKDQKGSTPLIHAVWPENVEVVEMLLDNDADPNIQNLRLNTALHFAYEKDNEHIINLLLAYGGTMSLHVKNSQGKTPVMLTNSEYLRWETGEDVEEIEAEKEKKELRKKAKKAPKGALAAAVKKKDIETVLKLLDGGADPNERNAKGSVPLMDAAWGRSVDIADMLIKCNADVNIQNLRGNTALHFAFERNSKPVVHLLLENGAGPSMKLKNTMGKRPPQLTTKQYLRNGAAKIVSNERKLTSRITQSPTRASQRNRKKKTFKDMEDSLPEK